MIRAEASEFMPQYAARGKKGRRALLRLLWARMEGATITQRAIDLQERNIRNGG